MSERKMVRCGDCAHFVRDGECGFLSTPEGRAKDRPFAYAPFWVWSDCYSDKEQVRANVKTMCSTFRARHEDWCRNAPDTGESERTKRSKTTSPSSGER